MEAHLNLDTTMPTYQITYERPDMNIPCKAIKTAHTAKDAIACLCVGNQKTGYKIKKTGVAINITETKEL